MKRKKNMQRRKATAAGIATMVVFFYAMCIDGIEEAYGMDVLVISGLIVMVIAGVCVWYSNRLDGGKR